MIRVNLYEQLGGRTARMPRWAAWLAMAGSLVVGVDFAGSVRRRGGRPVVIAGEPAPGSRYLTRQCAQLTGGVQKA